MSMTVVQYGHQHTTYWLALPLRRLTATCLQAAGDGPLFWSQVWIDEQDRKVKTGMLSENQRFANIRRKVGQHPNVKPIKKWLKANGAAWDDSTLIVGVNVINARLQRAHKLVYGCAAVSLTFRDKNLAMRFKLTFVGI